MIQKLKNGKFRVRFEYGHNKYYGHLLQQQIRFEKKLVTLKAATRKKEVEIKRTEKELETVLGKIVTLEKEFGKPVSIKTRRSFNCRNEWQAQHVEKLFKDAHDYESQGKELPDYLVKTIVNQKDAPYREDFVQELGYQLSMVSGSRAEVVENFSFSIFTSQADINEEWIEYFSITAEEVKIAANSFCSSNSSDIETIPLKGKTYLFTGSFMGITVCEDYVKALHKLAKAKNVDGIIVAGPWVKYIFLHKTAKTQKVLDSVKKLAEDKIKIYALRSNVESADLIPELKDLGITFVTKIEDENNVFLSHKFSRKSNKDQLGNWRDYVVNKNLFVHTSYVAFEPCLRDDKLRYIVGSGSSSFFTPTSRIWANAFDSQRLASLKYDSIGGHILRFDDKSEVYPSSFHFSEKTRSILVNGEVYSASTQKTQKSDLHVIISDVHAKIMDRKAFKGFLQFLDKHKSRIKSLSINGDFFDNKLLCHHDEHNIKSQIENKIKHKSFLHEIAHSRLVLNMIVDQLGKYRKDIKLIFKMGNHEVNSLGALKKKSITHFLDTMLRLEDLLGLRDLGFEIIDSKKPFKIGKITLYHGHEMQRLKAAKNHGKESVCGHSHRGIIDNLGTILPTMQRAEDTDYLSWHTEPWTTGWAVLHEFDGHVTRPEFILYKNNKYFDFDNIIEVKVPVKDDVPKQITITYDLA